MTIDDMKTMPFDELRTLHREIGALIAQRRHEALEELKHKVAVLGFTAEDLIPKKKRGAAGTSVKYRDPEMPDNSWSGRGKPPAWLRDKLEQGRALDEFLSSA